MSSSTLELLGWSGARVVACQTLTSKDSLQRDDSPTPKKILGVEVDSESCPGNQTCTIVHADFESDAPGTGKEAKTMEKVASHTGTHVRHNLPKCRKII